MRLRDRYLYVCIYVWFKKELLVDYLFKKLMKVAKKNG